MISTSNSSAILKVSPKAGIFEALTVSSSGESELGHKEASVISFLVVLEDGDGTGWGPWRRRLNCGLMVHFPCCVCVCVLHIPIFIHFIHLE